jgi:hypothetical protein
MKPISSAPFSIPVLAIIDVAMQRYLIAARMVFILNPTLHLNLERTFISGRKKYLPNHPFHLNSVASVPWLSAMSDGVTKLQTQGFIIMGWG